MENLNDCCGNTPGLVKGVFLFDSKKFPFAQELMPGTVWVELDNGFVFEAKNFQIGKVGDNNKDPQDFIFDFSIPISWDIIPLAPGKTKRFILRLKRKPYENTGIGKKRY